MFRRIANRVRIVRDALACRALLVNWREAEAPSSAGRGAQPSGSATVSP